MRRYRRSLRRRLRLQARQALKPLAEVTNYSDLIAALKARRAALKLSQEELDDIAGFTTRYVSKIEMATTDEPFERRVVPQIVKRRRKPKAKNRSGRTLGGQMSMPILLQALGVKLVLVEEQKQR